MAPDTSSSGNWSNYTHKTNGSTDLSQSRTHDLANEITEINSSTAHVASDLDGSMTKVPIPGNWSDHYCTVYDAWNRPVQVLASDGTTNIAQYQYDGRNYRTVKKTYTSGSLSETRHFYYNNQWQCLEERIESGGTISSYANRQYVWGNRYVDELILRDRDADGNTSTGNLGVSGSGLEERLYALQDPNWNVVAIADTSGAVQERYCYSAYGTPTFLTSGFGSRSSSNYAWDALYTGRQYDPETGLYHQRNRPYGAEIGRFTSRDPIGYFIPNEANNDQSGTRHNTPASGNSSNRPDVSGSAINANSISGKVNDFNLYRYVGNNPLVHTDPTGEIVFWAWGCVTCGCCGGVAATTCAVICVKDGFWDKPGEGKWECFKKCMKASAVDAGAFSDVCQGACFECMIWLGPGGGTGRN